MVWARLERQRCLVEHIGKSLLKCQFIANSKYRRRGSLKESNKRLNNKNLTHKFTSKWHQKRPLNRLQNGTAKRPYNCTSHGGKHVRKTSLHTNLLAIKVRKNKLLSSLTFKQKLPRKMRQRQHQQTIIWCADLVEAHSTVRRRNHIENKVHLIGKAGAHTATTRRNQAAVTIV